MHKPTSLLKFILILLIPIIAVMLLVIIVDPFFHFHKPISGISYFLSDGRYQNDGIVKHFDYDAIVTGTSEVQNCNISELYELFGVNAVKTCFSSGSLAETNSLITTAVEYNPNIRYVFRSLDTAMINVDSEFVAYSGFPYYLYDKNPINDYKYIFNKEVVLRSIYSILNTIRGVLPTNFDEYDSFYQLHPFGKEYALLHYTRPDIIEYETSLTDIDKNRIKENLDKNVIAVAKEHPEIQFYYFIPPYSICVWDATKRVGQINQIVDQEIYTYELLMNIPNIKVFSFNDLTEIVTDLDLYMDSQHYNQDVLSFIFKSMAKNEYILTPDNYLSRFEFERSYYSAYDYESIFN